MLLAKLFATCVGKDGRGAEMLAMVARGLELMQSNAEQLISLALCSGPTFFFPECLDDSLFFFVAVLQEEVGLGRASAVVPGHLQPVIS